MTRPVRDWMTHRYEDLGASVGRWALPAWLAAGLVLLVTVTTTVGLAVATVASGAHDVLPVGVAEWVVDHRMDWLTEVVWVVTHLGDGITLVVLGVAVGLAWRLRLGDWSGLAVMMGAYWGALVVYSGVKRIVARARPPLEVAVGDAPGLSFPSGHATGSAAVYVALALLVAVVARPAWYRWAMVGGAGLAVAVGLSRVYLGVHWVSDVVAGLTAGAAWACVVVTPLWAHRRHAIGSSPA